MSKEVIPIQLIAERILLVRGEKVLLDRHLAALYGVETRTLNQAVKRNASRFPGDFMFVLSRDEIGRISQSVTSSAHLKFSKQVRAFTEQGVAMLSSVYRAWGAHASRVLVSASRRNDLPVGRGHTLKDSQSPRWRDAIANARDARAPRS